ncbi:anti-sigma factor antagonist [Clostridia bacterium]|nr:anti-sigma factor antagonist [Clostridia bacterium]
MNITRELQGDTLVLKLSGRLDTTTSTSLQSEILASFTGGKIHLELDFADIVYVSSAGLRVLLIGKKTAMSKGLTFSVSNVSDDVFDVFKMTGFDSVLGLN